MVNYSWGRDSHDLLKQLGLDHAPKFMVIEVSVCPCYFDS